MTNHLIIQTKLAIQKRAPQQESEEVTKLKQDLVDLTLKNLANENKLLKYNYLHLEQTFQQDL